MPDLTRVDSAHQDLTDENNQLEQAAADELAAQAAVTEAKAALDSAQADLAAKQQALATAVSNFNAAADRLSAESQAVKVEDGPEVQPMRARA